MWYLKDLYVTANYHGHTITGKVRDSRTKVGGTVIHYVDFDQPQPVGFRNTMRDGVIINHSDILKVMDNV